MASRSLVECVALTALAIVSFDGRCLARQAPVNGAVGVATSHVWGRTDGGSNWVGRSVSLGAHGEQVFAGYGLNHPGFGLFGAHDALPAAQLWSVANGAEQPLMVDSAEDADVHVSISEEDAASVNERIIRVRFFRSASATPVWTYTYPLLTAGHQAVGVSDDGRTILALISNPTANGRYDVLCFGANSPTPLWIESLPAAGVGGPLWRVDIAPSGRFVAANIGSVSYLFDVVRRRTALALDQGGMLSETGVAVADDGSAFAIGGTLRVYAREPDGTYSLTYEPPPTDGGVVRVVLSAHGETVAWGVSRGYPSSLVDVYAADLRSKAITLHDQHGSSGAQQNFVNALAISADGSRLAVGEVGDALDLPEVRVYAKDDSVPIATFELPGAVHDVDLSADGQWVASTGEDCHSPCGPFGRIDLFRIGGATLDYTGIPHLGGSLALSAWATPGEIATLLVAPGVLDPPRTIPGLGAVFVDAAQLRSISLGVVPASGRLDATIAVPADPESLGRTFGLQVAFGAPFHALSTSWSSVTPVP
jgi:hypothetical protein